MNRETPLSRQAGNRRTSPARWSLGANAISPERQADANLELDGVIAKLRQLRAASQLSRYRHAAPPLPSHEAIEEIVDDLVAALYPRHFGPPGLNAEDADAFVAKTLSKSLPRLKIQVDLALALDQEHRGKTPNLRRRPARDVTAKFAAALPRVRAQLDKDVRAAFANDPSAKSIDEVIFCFPGSRRSCATVWRTSSISTRRFSRGSSPRSPTPGPGSTSIPARRSARASLSITPPARRDRPTSRPPRRRA